MHIWTKHQLLSLKKSKLEMKDEEKVTSILKFSLSLKNQLKGAKITLWWGTHPSIITCALPKSFSVFVIFDEFSTQFDFWSIMSCIKEKVVVHGNFSNSTMELYGNY